MSDSNILVKELRAKPPRGTVMTQACQSARGTMTRVQAQIRQAVNEHARNHRTFRNAVDSGDIDQMIVVREAIVARRI